MPPRLATRPRCPTRARPPALSPAALAPALSASQDRLATAGLAGAFTNYLHGVLPGRAQPLEKHADAIHAAFAPLRDALRSMGHRTVRVYRGEPRKRPRIRRAFLSWALSAELAGGFATELGSHVVTALVPVDDIVGAYVYRVPSGPGIGGAGGAGGYRYAPVELLVQDRPAYHRCSLGGPPRYVPLGYAGKSDREALLALIARHGGRVLRERRRKAADADYWSGYPPRAFHGTLYVALPEAAALRVARLRDAAWERAWQQALAQRRAAVGRGRRSPPMPIRPDDALPLPDWWALAWTGRLG